MSGRNPRFSITRFRLVLLPTVVALVFAGLVQYRIHLLGGPYEAGWNAGESLYFHTIGFIAMAPVVLFMTISPIGNDLNPFVLSFCTWLVLCLVCRGVIWLLSRKSKNH
jgi:hypothetical protein